MAHSPGKRPEPRPIPRTPGDDLGKTGRPDGTQGQESTGFEFEIGTGGAVNPLVAEKKKGKK
jgi:hypothetical protein